MFRAVKLAIASLLLASAVNAAAQSGYQVVSLNSSGTIVGTVKWSGPLPRLAAYPITKDPAICDPDSHKTRDLERLIVGPQGGVANTVVFLKNISVERRWRCLSHDVFWIRGIAVTSRTFFWYRRANC